MNTRMKKLIEILQGSDMEGIALNPGPTLTYLTGMNFHLMERPTVLLVSRAGVSGVILPFLEKGKLPEELLNIRAFTYGDDPNAWPSAFEEAKEALEIVQGKWGVEPTRLRYLELSYLKNAMPNVEFLDGSAVFSSLRINKDEDEIGKMKRAVKIAQSALLETLEHIKEGMTEKEIANVLIIQLLRAGSDPELPFAPIVAVGENSANPHAVPTNRALGPGDLLLIDWGASYDGYFSDITRTFTFGAVDTELLKIGEIVMQANYSARQIGQPGIEAGAVDRAARSVISTAGYGHAFIHRTGHGLGLEAHEDPYIFGENDSTLTTGATFTIEPGIYLPGKGGVRIEDDVVVTKDGLESLTDLPRQLLPLEDFMG